MLSNVKKQAFRKGSSMLELSKLETISLYKCLYYMTTDVRSCIVYDISTAEYYCR